MDGIRVGAALALAAALAVPTAAQAQTQPVFVNGQAQVVPAMNVSGEWIRHRLWVETEFDTDGDGQRGSRGTVHATRAFTLPHRGLSERSRARVARCRSLATRTRTTATRATTHASRAELHAHRGPRRPSGAAPDVTRCLRLGGAQREGQRLAVGARTQRVVGLDELARTRGHGVVGDRPAPRQQVQAAEPTLL